MLGKYVLVACAVMLVDEDDEDDDETYGQLCGSGLRLPDRLPYLQDELLCSAHDSRTHAPGTCNTPITHTWQLLHAVRMQVHCVSLAHCCTQDWPWSGGFASHTVLVNTLLPGATVNAYFEDREVPLGCMRVSNVRCSACGSLLGWTYRGAREHGCRASCAFLVQRSSLLVSAFLDASLVAGRRALRWRENMVDFELEYDYDSEW